MGGMRTWEAEVGVGVLEVRPLRQPCALGRAQVADQRGQPTGANGSKGHV